MALTSTVHPSTPLPGSLSACASLGAWATRCNRTLVAIAALQPGPRHGHWSVILAIGPVGGQLLPTGPCSLGACRSRRAAAAQARALATHVAQALGLEDTGPAQLALL
ncbi:MAG: hypothetical protein R3181_13560 [Rubricoccaceae bacterium]|nr:hypothetical protein [Rubricoccaceae bacterium]